MPNDHRTPLDHLALGAASGEHVATLHVRGALDDAVDSLDRLGSPLTLEQHAILTARVEDALGCIGFCSIKLGAAILIEEEAERAEKLSAFVPTLLQFAARVSGEHALEEMEQALRSDLVDEVFGLASLRTLETHPAAQRVTTGGAA